MRRLFFEEKIIGINAILIFTILTVVFAFVAYFGGELLNLSYLGFEVIYPFMTAIAVGEWGKTRADTNFDSIAAQSNSLFKWVVVRFSTVFFMGSMFAFISMVIVYFVRNEIVLWEIALLYFPPAFFLSTLCVLCSICFSAEHIATLVSGTFWILTMLARSLLRIPGVEYIYLFIRYAGDMNGIWLINKMVLMLIGLVLWIATYVLCKKRVFMK